MLPINGASSQKNHSGVIFTREPPRVVTFLVAAVGSGGVMPVVAQDSTSPTWAEVVALLREEQAQLREELRDLKATLVGE